MILATLARYPLMHAQTAIAATVEQFLSFQTEVSLEDNAPTYDTFTEQMPRLLPQLMRARQQTGRIDADLLNLVHTPLAALAIAGLAGALMFRRRLKIAPQLAALCLTILLALAANAAICGIFSHPVDRYQSRLVAVGAVRAGPRSGQPMAAQPSWDARRFGLDLLFGSTPGLRPGRPV